MKKTFFKDSFNLTCSKLSFEKGLMLLEVLTVVAIILVLTLVVMVNHREGQKKVILERGAHKLAQDIRAAQEMAISGKEFDGKEPFGYGIFIKNTPPPQIKYILYADIIPSDDEIYSNLQEIVESLEFEKGLFIKAIEIDDIPGYNYTNIYFQAPDPIIKIKENNQADDFNKVKITIALESDDTRTKTVTVNTVGLIEIAENSSPSPPPSGECRGSVEPAGYVPCDEIEYGGYLNCFFPDTCTPCGCECFMAIQCRDPIAGRISCSSLTEGLCNDCGCLWWP